MLVLPAEAAVASPFVVWLLIVATAVFEELQVCRL